MAKTGTIDQRAATELRAFGHEDHASVEEFMQKIFRKDPAPTAPSSLADAGLPDAGFEDAKLDVTAGLIERASETIQFLASRCEILETELRQSLAQAAEQADFIASLKDVVSELKRTSDTLEVDLKATTVRCEAAEARVVSLEEYQKAVTLRAKRAEGLSGKLQQQVEAAFGAGSPIGTVMNAVSIQQAAE